MHDGSQGNAMTEIALALAMGFFSIMVLTMVSMGAGQGASEEGGAAILKMVPAQAGEARAVAANSDDTIIIYHQGRFLDTELRSIDPRGLAASGRVVLALDPALPMAEALHAQAQVSARDLVVSVLDARWQAALADGPAGSAARP